MRRIPIRHLAGWLFPGTKDMERSRTGGEGENEGEQRLLLAPRGATSHWRHRVWVRVCAREIEGGRNGCLRACLRLAEVPKGGCPHGKIGKEFLYHLWTLIEWGPCAKYQLWYIVTTEMRICDIWCIYVRCEDCTNHRRCNIDSIGGRRSVLLQNRLISHHIMRPHEEIGRHIMKR